MLPLEMLLSGKFFQILVLVHGKVDFTLSSICLYYKYNQVDVIFQIKYTTVLQKFFFNIWRLQNLISKTSPY